MIKIHLSRLLGERKMSQAALARKTGIRANTVNGLYHGFADRLSIQHLDKICEALNCDLHDLLEYVPPPKSDKPITRSRVTQ